ncbi:hypothetical protein IKG54_01035 [Candidatus Saccharibacteria bacterium]|nr:hypothetical protein [Candidatus Saccharibacteria bacterium]
MSSDGTHLLVSVDGGDSQYVELRTNPEDNNTRIGTTSCNAGATECYITVDSGDTGYINYNSGAFALFAGGSQVGAETAFNASSANHSVLIQDASGQDPQPGPDEPFDGNIYFVWDCNGVCYHHFTDIWTETGTPIGQTINLLDSNITDDTDNSKHYTLGDEHNQGWVGIEASVNEQGKDLAGWDYIGAHLNDIYTTTELILYGNESQHIDGGKLNPIDFGKGKNSLSTNVAMQFQVVLHGAEYVAVEVSNDPADYTYFPGFWEPGFTYNPVIDISETTAEQPAIIESYLNEPNVILNGLNDVVTSITAINAPTGAVTIDNAGGIWTLTFASNYYDRVVFEITDANGTYYAMVARTAIKVHDNFGPDETDPSLIIDAYYPTTYNYDDFQVVANVIYNDGTTDFQILDTISTQNESGGQNLRASSFKISVDKSKIAGAYFTIIKKGALSGNSYGGTFSGSGAGSYYDAETREVNYLNNYNVEVR